VAEQFEGRTADVNVAIQELIRRGVFKPQIDGKLYVPEGNGAGLTLSEQTKKAGA